MLYRYKSTNTDADASTKVQILTQQLEPVKTDQAIPDTVLKFEVPEVRFFSTSSNLPAETTKQSPTKFLNLKLDFLVPEGRYLRHRRAGGQI